MGWHPSWTESKRENELSRTAHRSLLPDCPHSMVRGLLLPAMLALSSGIVSQKDPFLPRPALARVLDQDNRKSNQDVAIHQFTDPPHLCSCRRTKATSLSLTLANLSSCGFYHDLHYHGVGQNVIMTCLINIQGGMRFLHIDYQTMKRITLYFLPPGY